MKALLLVRLEGVTAHYRDPRYNTGSIGKNALPIATLHCPPPCTIHAMLCAARGGWVESAGLIIGWRMDFAEVCSDFQTCQLPQKRRPGDIKRGLQATKISPRLREFLSFPVLTMLIISGADSSWFRSPANPLLFGRSEDLITAKEVKEHVDCSRTTEARLGRQCLPIPFGSGPLYSAPLYFKAGRVPVDMSPKIDARVTQPIRVMSSSGHPSLARLDETGETFFLWDFGRAAG